MFSARTFNFLGIKSFIMSGTKKSILLISFIVIFSATALMLKCNPSNYTAFLIRQVENYTLKHYGLGLAIEDFEYTLNFRGLKVAAHKIKVQQHQFQNEIDDLSVEQGLFTLGFFESIRKMSPTLTQVQFSDLRVVFKQSFFDENTFFDNEFLQGKIKNLELRTKETDDLTELEGILHPYTSSFAPISFGGTISHETKTEKKGKLFLRTRKIELPFKNSVVRNLKDFGVQTIAEWNWDGQNFEIQKGKFNLSNDIANLEGNFTLSYNNSNISKFKIKGNAEKINFKKAKKLFSSDLLNPQLSKWLDSAFSKGELSENSFDFEYDELRKNNDNLKFKVKNKLKHVNLSFAKGWQQLENLSGDLEINQNRLFIDNVIFEHHGLKSRNGQVTIPFKNPKVLVKFLLEGEATNAQDYIMNNPLNKEVGFLYDDLYLENNLSIDLNLEYPLDSFSKIKFRSILDLNNNNLIINRYDKKIKNIQGKIEITENSIKSDGLSGVYAGEKVEATILNRDFSKPTNLTEVKVKTIFHQPLLNSLFGNNIPPFVNGKADLNAVFLFFSNKNKNWFQLNLESSMQGVGVVIPNIVDKDPFDAKGLNLEVTNRDGISLRGKLKDLAAINVQLKENWEGYIHFAPFVNDMQKETDNEIKVKGENILGSFNVKSKANSYMPFTIKANIRKLKLQKTGENSKSSKQPQEMNFDPNFVPHLDLFCKQCIIDDYEINKFHLETQKAANGLHIKNIQASVNNTFTINLDDGYWLKSLNGPKSFIQGKIDFNNLGKAAADFGFSDKLENFRGKALFSLKWPGSIFAYDRMNFTGGVSFNVKEGRLLKRWETLENILGILTLNLKGIVSQDYQVFQAKGNFKLTSGVMTTEYFLAALASYLIKYQGDLDLVNQSYDGVAHIYPNINKTVISGLAFFVSPIFGIYYGSSDSEADDTYLNKLTSTRYKITGPWSDPRLK